MAAGEYDFLIEQGATFVVTLTYQSAEEAPISLAGCIVRMHVRKNIADPTILLELTTANGRISIIDGPAGKFRLQVSATDTGALTWRGGQYDLEILFPDGTVDRMLEGKVRVRPEITR